jgi:FkbM family methyltransferase
MITILQRATDQVRSLLQKRSQALIIARKLVPIPLLAKLCLNDVPRKEREVLRNISKLRLSNGQVFVDIGAYVGYYSIYASKKVGMNGMVVAVEPHPKNFKMLLMNTRGLNNVIPINAAIWSENTTAKLYLGQGMSLHSLVYAGGGEYIKVRALTLDSLMRELNISRVDVVKIDTEGAELEVLKGSESTLKLLKSLLIEIHGKNPEEFKKAEERIAEFLRPYGFSVEKLGRKHLLGIKL